MTDTPRIRVLSEVVTNKIAAGEVVERPASVLKELAENSLDSGATRIELSVVSGGRKLVGVADNGMGMSRDDALLAIERHATSKIWDERDIETIGTLGFRGEALAAISAVSRFTIKTCSVDAVEGTELRISGGKLQDVREIGWPQGTTVEVRNLFFNVPARRKFLRTAQTELARIRQVFNMLALANPEVAFSLDVDGRIVHSLPAESGRKERIRELFGAEFVKDLARVQYARDELTVSGYVGLPKASRSDRSEEYVFVNRRPATAPLVMHAISEGYRTLLPGGRHPVVFLFLDMPTARVDVNVHPTKREVRFREPGLVRDTVIAAIRATLGAKEGIRFACPDGERTGRPGPASPAGASEPFLPEAAPREREFPYPGMHRIPAFGRPDPPAPGTSGEDQQAAGPGGPWVCCRVLGRIGDLYVVMETEDGYVLMDPHAAHERVLFERLLNDALSGQVKSQGLLMPETIQLPPKSAERLRGHLDLLQTMGFGISEFGGDSFLVEALPARIAFVAPGTIVPDLANALEQAGPRGGAAEVLEEKIAQAACKAAVKARDRLSNAEIEQLVGDLARTEMPYTCPHGRPTMIFTSYKELARKFGRG